MNQQDIKILITSQEESFFFTGGVGEEDIQDIEAQLNVEVPESYKWFLMNYGFGGINGVLINGVALDKSLQVVKATKSLREYGLPESLVVVENMDEYVYCFDTARMDGGECPIVDWDQKFGIGKKQYRNLYEYLYDRFSDAIENL
ncbi:SMI1/KNR4 family protein [Tumebacillus flagellatus]|uniref:Knr4/Smi1-like domain-containing protein n=1 Tax=Tumebacillus flagellatus TaxID=1157490 RepID=A0A074LI46_9BACL|nr:SMI1/KNR4 family protein [Tumebacillus flagellatus]KEO80819.1 hypothetical protein EL26_24250 [Tumebacillus flagellatus]